ncbi:hypothetical protein [Natronolimnohabitans innermongolicus]|uniref:Uncharacterized protein n=1 Tax=Natronolimnohabitans innermongolicus JCM 12255 TaxID=1227499 RepID=L9X251_9EURY|nr:hypothetical protein [Natronolimnohabitans innermongolicus]ELY55849.1 hypothetical protein C493_10238 [Natronolimnohabitans innermongolicus JCM 12255]
MNRRQYLIRTGAGASAVASTALAGCLGSVTGGDETVSVANRTGDRELSRAIGDLNDAALALLVDDDLEDPADLEFDPDDPLASIDSARERLETAATELDDRDDDVSLLRTYADVLERLVAVTETVTDDTLESDIDAVFAAIDGDGDLESASATLDERIDELDGAQENHDEAAADVRDFDDDFEELVRIDRAELEDGVEALGDVLSPLVTLGDGLDAMLEGYDALERGRDALENEAFDDAEDEFDAAESAFSTSGETLESEPEPPSGLADTFAETRCRSGHLATAAAEFGDSAAAAADGDVITAANHRSNAEDALEDARNCSR